VDWPLKVKSPEEILEKCRDMVRRHRRRYMQRNLRPCPLNCKLADMLGHKVTGCQGCGSDDLEQCWAAGEFVPLFTKEELARQFAEDLQDPKVLLTSYRDLTVFFWCLNLFDMETVEGHTVKIMDVQVVDPEKEANE
jgi:hypothetical protein